MRPWIAVSGALIAAGVALFLYKVLVLGYPLSTAEEPGTWRVDFVVTVTGQGSRTVVEIPLPRTSGYQRLLTEEVKSEQMRFSIGEGDGDRRGRWSGTPRRLGQPHLRGDVRRAAYGRPIPPSETGGNYPASVRRLPAAPRRASRSPIPAIAELSQRAACSTPKNKAALARAGLRLRRRARSGRCAASRRWMR